jgi:hypothetical protein
MLVILFIFVGNSIYGIYTAQSSQITIRDSQNEGILSFKWDYFTVWNRGSNSYTLSVNLTAADYSDTNGGPHLNLTIWKYSDFNEKKMHLTTNVTDLMNTSSASLTCESNTIYVVGVYNFDETDESTYDISFRSDISVDFQYTQKYHILDGEIGSTTTTITFFGEAHPGFYRIAGSPTRLVLSDVFQQYNRYFRLENKGSTTKVFVGIIGFGYYYDDVEITAYIIDYDTWEDNTTAIYLYTVMNDSCGVVFEMKGGHKYSVWIKCGNSLNQADLTFIVDSLGTQRVWFEQKPSDFTGSDGIEVLRYYEDPYLVEQRLQRNLRWAIAGGSIVSVLFIVILWKKIRA